MTTPTTQPDDASTDFRAVFLDRARMSLRRALLFRQLAARPAGTAPLRPERCRRLAVEWLNDVAVWRRCAANLTGRSL